MGFDIKVSVQAAQWEVIKLYSSQTFLLHNSVILTLHLNMANIACTSKTDVTFYVSNKMWLVMAQILGCNVWVLISYTLNGFFYQFWQMRRPTTFYLCFITKCKTLLEFTPTPNLDFICTSEQNGVQAWHMSTTVVWHLLIEEPFSSGNLPADRP